MRKAGTLGLCVVLAVMLAVAVQAGASSEGNAPVAGQAAAGSDADRSIAPGAQLIEALTTRDFDRARSLLAPDIEFKAYTPTKHFFELSGADAVMTLLREWYDAESVIEGIETERIVDRQRVGYRIRWTSPEGAAFVFEQQAFYDVAEGRITQLQLVCSGDRPLAS